MEKPSTLADVRGPKGTLIVFICNHCPYVNRAGTFNGPLHEAGGLCLLHEFVDIGEPFGIALGNSDPIDDRSVVVFQHACARKLGGITDKRAANWP